MPPKNKRLDESESEADESEWESDEYEWDEWKAVTLVARKNRSHDGKVVRIKANKICVSESNLINKMYLETIRVADIEIHHKILEVIVGFCHYRASLKLFHTEDEELLQGLLEKFDSDFLVEHCKTDSDLATFLRAACELEIKSLALLTSNVIVVNMVAGGKSTCDAKKMFHLKGCLTNNEMNEDLHLMSWAFE